MRGSEWASLRTQDMDKKEPSRKRDQLEQRSITGSFTLMSLWAMPSRPGSFLFILSRILFFWFSSLFCTSLISPLQSQSHYSINMLQCLIFKVYLLHVIFPLLSHFFVFLLYIHEIHFSVGSSLTESPRRFLPHYLRNSCHLGSLTDLNVAKFK